MSLLDSFSAFYNRFKLLDGSNLTQRHKKGVQIGTFCIFKYELH